MANTAGKFMAELLGAVINALSLIKWHSTKRERREESAVSSQSLFSAGHLWFSSSNLTQAEQAMPENWGVELETKWKADGGEEGGSK